MHEYGAHSRSIRDGDAESQARGRCRCTGDNGEQKAVLPGTSDVI